MLSIAVLTNEVCTAWSDAFLVLARNGTTVWLCLMNCLLHFPRRMIHRGDVVTNIICVDINPKNADWTGYRHEIECKLSSRHLLIDCQKDEKLFWATLLKAASHHIPTGRCKLYTQQVPAEILAMMEERDDLRKYDPASPWLATMNNEITKGTSYHKRRQWREFV